jgi:YegS/Rv2252/BmrU family lipid kinase
VKTVVVINPISGTGGRPEIARQRAELAARLLERARVDGEIFVTEGPGHARDLARSAIAHGARRVLAWGGDGTINEIGSALAFTDAALGVIPSGSGNGLARELQIPFDPAAAFDIALGADERVVDAGELDGRFFVNIAGVGLDARVAHQFAMHGLVRRGFVRYVQITSRELLSYKPADHAVIVDGEPHHVRAWVIAIANSRQYGNGAIIAPQARLDDGLLDVVVVQHRPLAATLWHIPRVFAGTVDQVPGVTIRRGRDIEVSSTHPVVYHVDGEPYLGAETVRARVQARALRVCARLRTH